MKYSVLAITLLGLTACGGGGSESKPDPVEKAPTPPVVETPVAKTQAELYDIALETLRSQVRGHSTYQYFVGFDHGNNGIQDVLILRDNAEFGYFETSVLLKGTDEGYTAESTVVEGYARRSLVADYNGDGLTDIGTFWHGREFPGKEHENGGVNKIFFQGEGGSLVDQAVNYNMDDPEGDYTHSACNIDINNDGFQDIYVQNVYHNDPYMLVNDGHGNFNRDDTLIAELEYDSVWCMVADFNNDGFDDLVLGAPGGPTGFWQKNMYGTDVILFGTGERLVYDEDKSYIADRNYPSTLGWGGDQVHTITLSMEPLDWNGDNCLDYVANQSNYFNTNIFEIWEGDCTGGFALVWSDESRGEVQLDFTLGWRMGIHVQDFNNDGLPDFIAHNYDAGGLLANNSNIYMSNGTGYDIVKMTKEIGYTLPLSIFLTYNW